MGFLFMARKKQPSKQKKQQIAANSSNSRRMSQSRINYATGGAPSNFGDTLRNDAAQYGYPCQLTFNEYFNAYSRGGFFAALVDIIPERCFNQFPTIVDGDDNDSTRNGDTAFEREFKKLNSKFNLIRTFKEAEKYKDVGHYSAIIPIFKESGENPSLKNPPGKAMGGVDSLRAINLYYEPECEASTDVVSDIMDEDYNKPEYYTVNPAALSSRQTTNAAQIEFHRDRVFLLTNATSPVIYGKPVLEAPFNALFDAAKTRGASAEGYRKNAMQKTVLNAENEIAMKILGDANLSKKLDESIDDFTDNFNNMLKTGGMSAQMLQGTLEDPTGTFTICLQEACAARRAPVTEVIGFMTGERSSSENSSSFNKRLKGEQENEYGPRLKSFLWWLVDLGILPEPSSGEIEVIWPDIAEPTLSEKLEMAGKMMVQNDLAFKSRQELPWTTEEVREIAGYDSDKPQTEYEQEDDKTDMTLDENPEDSSTEER